MIYNVRQGGATSADRITYDNTESGLESTNVQGAVDEVTDRTIFPNSEVLYPDIKDGKYGFNTDPNRGADTFHPFSSGGGRYEFSLTGQAEGYSTGATCGGNSSIKLPSNGCSLFRIESNSGCAFSGDVSGTLSDGSDISSDTVITISASALTTGSGYGQYSRVTRSCVISLS